MGATRILPKRTGSVMGAKKVLRAYDSTEELHQWLEKEQHEPPAAPAPPPSQRQRLWRCEGREAEGEGSYAAV